MDALRGQRWRQGRTGPVLLRPFIITALILIAGGLANAQDVTPPAPVTSLTIITVSNNRIGLQWSATGDDGMAGIATTYDIRYAINPIANEAAFAAALQAAGEPAPAAAGTIQ